MSRDSRHQSRREDLARSIHHPIIFVRLSAGIPKNCSSTFDMERSTNYLPTVHLFLHFLGKTIVEEELSRCIFPNAPSPPPLPILTFRHVPFSRHRRRCDQQSGSS